MNPFLLGPRERAQDWKALRQSLPALPEEEQFARLAAYWAKAPLSRYAYDAHDPASWPTIWEMINANEWCDHSVAIGMEATLRLSGFSADRLKLVLMNDRDLSEIKFVLQIDGQKWLNYHYGIVTDIPDSQRTVMCAWQFNGKTFIAVRD